jgi:hypothetical protein
MKVTLTGYYINKTGRGGEPLIGKNGLPYIKVNMTTKEKVEGAHAMSKLFSDEREIPDWKAGDVVDIEIKTSGDFVNWNIPKNSPPLKFRTVTPKTVENTPQPQPNAPQRDYEAEKNDRILWMNAKNVAGQLLAPQWKGINGVKDLEIFELLANFIYNLQPKK